jgi:integrase/recombinase XerC
MSSGSIIKDIQSRRFFQAWRPIATRQGLYHIVKTRLAAVAEFLDEVGDVDRTKQLRLASPHWLPTLLLRGPFSVVKISGMSRHC